MKMLTNPIEEGIQELLTQINSKLTIAKLEKIPQSGSDRQYFRVLANNGNSYIATYSLNTAENETFLHFTSHFKAAHLPVPKVYAINESKTLYLQEDFGNQSLLDVLEVNGKTSDSYLLFQKSLAALAAMQIKGGEGFNYDDCITAKAFGKQAMMNDLLYFKYYFLDTLHIPYDKEALLNDFDTLSTTLANAEHQHFMFRDFQSRNIMVKNNEVHFIDYQGGMKGALQYDVASLLWQAKAQLSQEWKDCLLQYYIAQVESLLGKSINRPSFENEYNGFVLIRLLQVLGAYGFRGLFERKAHFLTSIPLALKSIQYFMASKQLSINMPVFTQLLQQISSDAIIHQFTPTQANEYTALVIEVSSFSYLKNGIPTSTNDTGGGFVFDMRGILNPGRFDDYKKLSGKDKPVQDFLDQKTLMNRFLNSAWDLLDVSIENYLARNFEHLSISFGCTGGQHRSVFAAEQTARHLRNKYKVKVILKHINEADWVR